MLRPIEVAELLAVSRKHVYRLIDRGDLKAVHVGGAVRIPPAELDRLTGGET
jgi:excisionase family DNA binding protein